MQSLMRSCEECVVRFIGQNIIDDLSNLPPSLRQRLLDQYREVRERHYDDCFMSVPAAFCNPTFLEEMQSLSMRRSVTDDSRFLDAFIASINRSPGIIESLTNLNLAVYMFNLVDMRSTVSNLPNIVINYDAAIGVVKLCSRLKSLTLRFVRLVLSENCFTDDDEADDLDTPEKYLDEISQFDHVQRLNELYLNNELRRDVVVVRKLLSRQENVCKLILQRFKVISEDWRMFMEKCRESLTAVTLMDTSIGDIVFEDEFVEGEVLPIPLPQLQHLIVEMLHKSCSGDFVKNINQCSQLTSLSLKLFGRESADDLVTLSKLPSLENVAIEVDGSNENFGTISRLFGQHIWSAKIESTDDRSLDNDAAFRTFVASCPNLEQLDLAAVTDKAGAEIIPIFSDASRAAKLIDVSLTGELPQVLIDDLFKNCTCLDSLKILSCPQTFGKSENDLTAKPRKFLVTQYDDFDEWDDPYDSDYEFDSEELSGNSSSDFEYAFHAGILFEIASNSDNEFGSHGAAADDW